jgi:hypothetical protein
MILDGQRRSLLGKPIRQGTGWGPAALQRYSDGDEPLHHQQRGQGMLAALVTAFGVTILLVGTALAIVATLKAASQVPGPPWPWRYTAPSPAAAHVGAARPARAGGYSRRACPRVARLCLVGVGRG